MGLGATTADITLMQNNTPASKYGKDNANCAFACHQSDKPGTDYYALAKSLKVTMRIDVVRQATKNLMTTAKKTESLDGQYRVAIYSFGAYAKDIDQKKPTAYPVSALTSDLAQSANDADKIDLMIMPSAGYNQDSQTNFNSVLSNMKDIIPTPGPGLSSSKPQKVLFFVSDGVNDGYDCAYNNIPKNPCRRITPLDTAQCTAIKASGIRIAVLYTTYIPLAKNVNAFYDSYVAGYAPTESTPSKIATQMEACASPGLYFEVGPSQGISEAMTALFNKVVSVVRINS
jgi:hypothetical protein